MDILQIVGIALAIVSIIAVIAYIAYSYRSVDLSKVPLLPSGTYRIHKGSENFSPLSDISKSTDASADTSVSWDASTTTLTYNDGQTSLKIQGGFFLYEFPDKQVLITYYHTVYGPANYRSPLKDATMNMPLFWNYS